MSTRIMLTVCEEVLIYQLSEFCLASCRHLQFENDLELSWEKRHLGQTVLILLLPHSSLYLVVISSSASNITLLQSLVLQKGRKQWAKLARVEDFVRELGYIKRNDSVSGLNYTLPSPSHS